MSNRQIAFLSAPIAVVFMAALFCVSAVAGELARTTVVVPPSSGPSVSVNSDYRMGQMTLEDRDIPTLDDMVNIVEGKKLLAAERDEDRLRAPALRDAALSYGARGGLAWASRSINRTLQDQSDKLTRTYAFENFLIAGPDGVTVLPPVISESRDTYEQFDAGKSLRVADTYYEIIQQARFAPVAPLWHSYLIRSYSVPEIPQDVLLPRNDGERDLWRRYVTEGWEQGIQQAQDIFRSDLARLERDFIGMVRYAQLLDTNQVSAPVIAGTNLGVTGTGQDMRVNDRAMRITQDPSLNVRNPREWSAPVSGQAPTEAAIPPRY